MKKIIILGIILTGILFSQTTEKKKKVVPGFMGKRFQLQVNAGTFFNFFEPYAYDQPYGQAYFGMNWKVGGDFHYVMTPKSSIGAFFQYSNTAAVVNNYYGSPSTFGVFPLVNLNLFYTGLSFKTYFGNNIAPVGPYFQIKCGASIMDINYVKTSDRSVFFNLTKGDFLLNIAFGRQHVIKKIITLDYGVELGLTGLGSGILPVYDTSIYDYKDPITGDILKAEVGRRIIIHNAFNFYVGLGVIF